MRDDNEGILLEEGKYVIMSIWKENAGGYLWGIGRYSLSIIKKHEQYC